jgi:predicted GIY-YIG superfamily endonuclease
MNFQARAGRSRQREKTKQLIRMTKNHWVWYSLKRLMIYEAIAFEKRIKGWSRR